MSVANSILTSKWTKVFVFLLCLAPVGFIVWNVLHDPTAQADPVAFITHRTGDWTIRFIVITLAITPLRKILHLPQLIRFRRMVGLYAFFYVFLHFSTWIVLDHYFNWSEMWADVLKRRFITVGFSAFVLMIPLAITSTAGWIRRLGGKRWQRLHKLIYVIAILGVIHYAWLVKSDERKPIFYGTLVGLLLAYRLYTWTTNRYKPVPGRAAAPPEKLETAETHS
ncbi:MAG: protein-methionine-sulfoxide reductase heme-binding subunit MsrQ [Candidatus Acidiferrales bacterium]